MGREVEGEEGREGKENAADAENFSPPVSRIQQIAYRAYVPSSTPEVFFELTLVRAAQPRF